MDKKDTKIRIENSGTAGIIWVMGWLFTIGFLQVPFFKGVLAILLWPYYIGDYLQAALK